MLLLFELFEHQSHEQKYKNIVIIILYRNKFVTKRNFFERTESSKQGQKVPNCKILRLVMAVKALLKFDAIIF